MVLCICTILSGADEGNLNRVKLYIVTLCKVGDLGFWDLRPVTMYSFAEPFAQKRSHAEIRQPPYALSVYRSRLSERESNAIRGPFFRVATISPCKSG